MIYANDYVRITKLGSPFFGELGKVLGLKSAAGDEWALVRASGDDDYYKMGELVKVGSPLVQEVMRKNRGR